MLMLQNLKEQEKRRERRRFLPKAKQDFTGQKNYFCIHQHNRLFCRSSELHLQRRKTLGFILLKNVSSICKSFLRKQPGLPGNSEDF